MVRRLCAVIAVLLASVVAPSAPVEASPTAVFMVLNGALYYTPGWDAFPQHQHFTWLSVSFTTLGVTRLSPTVLGTSDCFGSGESTSPGESIAAGQGIGTWACATGPMAGDYGEFSYARIGTRMTMAFIGDPLGTGAPGGELACDLEPLETIPPYHDFFIFCTGFVAGV